MTRLARACPLFPAADVAEVGGVVSRQARLQHRQYLSRSRLRNPATRRHRDLPLEVRRSQDRRDDVGLHPIPTTSTRFTPTCSAPGRAAVSRHPVDRDWGMREFYIWDPDGNLLKFGVPVVRDGGGVVSMNQQPARHLAQLNIGRLRYEADDPRMADFVDNLAMVNGIAERSDGFVWRYQDDSGSAIDTRPFDGDPRMAINMSVWENIEALERFVWQTVHKRFYRAAARMVRSPWPSAISSCGGCRPDIGPRSRRRSSSLSISGPGRASRRSAGKASGGAVVEDGAVRMSGWKSMADEPDNLVLRLLRDIRASRRRRAPT